MGSTPQGKQQEDPTGDSVPRTFNAGIVAGASFLCGGADSWNRFPKSPWTLHLRGGMCTGALGLMCYTGVRALVQENPYDGAALAMTSGSMMSLSSNLGREPALKPAALARHATASGLVFVGIYGLGWVYHKELICTIYSK